MPAIHSNPVRSGAATWTRRHAGLVSHVLLSVVIAAAGWFAVQWRELVWPTFGDEVVDWGEMGMDPFQRLSYDLPFLLRPSFSPALGWVVGSARSTAGVVILYMDEEGSRRLGQPPGGPWSRSLHARLLNVLTKDGARAVVFDVVFDTETAEDAVFAEAIRANGSTFLGATILANSEAPLTPEEAQRFLRVGIATEQLSRRNRPLYSAARGWGLLTFRPVDADYCVRRLFSGKARDGLDPWLAATWQAARALGATLPGEIFARRWVNYYGPAGRIESLGYHRALLEDGGVPPGYFKDKVVFVGARSQVGTSAKKLRDEFSTPWSRFSARAFTPGVEIHATTFLNLLHGDWLARVPLSIEVWIVVLLGLALAGLRWLRPWHAVLAGMAVAIGILVASCILQWQARRWWNWSVAVLWQVPLATVLAVGSRYYVEERRRRALRRAFGFYLSPELAREIADRDFALVPGGEKVVATLMFTDLQGFTALSEKLGDSGRIGEILRDYFTATTDEILAENGTVIKFIGDAVFAAWGAPLPQPDHARRAIRAACRLAQVSEFNLALGSPHATASTLRLRTRIGIHTGEALAGNLGSARRFDYTLIGDAVNVASRLEGANKYLGTSILVSDDTVRLLNGEFLLRRLGSFRVEGRHRPMVLHELLGDDPASRPPWLDAFERALAAWTRGDLAAARAGFAAARDMRGADGPSEFFLEQCAAAAISPGWTGEITLAGK